MCGRFTLKASPKVVADLFRLESLPLFEPRYNIAPTQTVLAARGHPRHEAVKLRWGLVPSWSKDTSAQARMINARAETVAEKPAFRGPFRRRRCLVLADGYYEWKAIGKAKQPFYFHLENETPFAFAGLWDSWNRGPEPLETCTILTTAAAGAVTQIHDRMPVILDAAQQVVWLDPDADMEREYASLIKPSLSLSLKYKPVSTYVNRAGNEGSACLEPATS